jgi:thioredoxin reductase
MMPVVDADLETNIPGLYLAGSIIEAECIRVAANQGHRIAKRVAGLVKGLGKAPSGVQDLIIIGAGPAGINAALTAKAIGLDVLVFDQYFPGATILGMPSGKTFEVNYKGNKDPAEGPLWFEDSPAPMLHSKWMDQIKASGLTVNENEPVTDIVRDKDRGLFKVRSVCGTYQARFVLLCIGKAGQPRQLDVPGEPELAERKRLHYRFRGPGTVKGKDILVVGGGNTAAEAVVGLALDNHVTLSYRRAEFERLTPKNKDALDALSNKGSVHIMLNSVVIKLEGDKAHILVNDENIERRFDEYFVLIGFELPLDFLRKIGVDLKDL